MQLSYFLSKKWK